MTYFLKKHLKTLIPGACAVALAAPIYAQDLEEIVVVARKREE